MMLHVKKDTAIVGTSLSLLCKVFFMYLMTKRVLPTPGIDKKVNQLIE